MQDNMINNVIIEGRKKISVSGVSDMECFDDGKVILYTSLGVMEIKGANFHMNKLSLDTGEVVVEGDIDSVMYENPETIKQTKKGFFAKMLG